MRPALIPSALAVLALLSACDDKSKGAADPERGSAAGEVLGGEVSDAMLPLDTARSTSPPDIRAVTASDETKLRDASRRTVAPTPDGNDADQTEPEAPASPAPSSGPPPQ